jgi:hypothetical protein
MDDFERFTEEEEISETIRTTVYDFGEIHNVFV